MVTRLGMSEAVGPIAYQENSEQVFLGRDYGRSSTISQKTLELIDSEIHRIVDEELNRARKILGENRDLVEVLTAALLERETIDAEEFIMLMEGKELPAPELEIDHSTGGETSEEVKSEEDSSVDSSAEDSDPQQG